MRPLALNSILVATDLSAGDVAAIRTAFELARLAGAQLHVVHAGPEDDATARSLERHIRDAEPTLDLLPDTTLRNADPESVIVEVAGMISADVIILGPHRSNRPHSPGGTAYRVAAEAGRPCLVLPGSLNLPLGSILVPIDASPAARGALAVAMTWASALRRRTPAHSPDGTRLVVLHVEAPGEGHDRAQHVLDDAMAAVGRVSDFAGVRIERAEGSDADAAATIRERAREGRFDLIALGTHAGLEGSTELGSVSSAVVQSTSCPMLLVPPRVWRERGGEPLP